MKLKQMPVQMVASVPRDALVSKRLSKPLMPEPQMRASYKRSDFSTLVRGQFYDEAVAASASHRTYSKIESP